MIVYVVRYNADTIEGMGPMILEAVYTDLEKAKTFIEKQQSGMGIKWRFNPSYEPGYNHPFSARTKSFARWDAYNAFWEILVVETSD